jgi:hypothetical protein
MYSSLVEAASINGRPWRTVPRELPLELWLRQESTRILSIDSRGSPAAAGSSRGLTALHFPRIEQATQRAEHAATISRESDLKPRMNADKRG